MSVVLDSKSAQITVSSKDGASNTVNENIGYWRFNSSDTNESVARKWDSVGRSIVANLTTNTYNDTRATVSFSANEMLD